MEFWGVEVEAGKPLKVQPDIEKLIHISQASLGELKDVKGIKNVPLRLKINDKKFIIGNLSPEDRPQLMVDLVFEKEFELSHDLKNGSVYFIGYVADHPASDDEFDDDDEVFPDFDEDEPVDLKENGKVKPQDVKAAKKILAAAGKAEAKKEDQSDSDDDEEDSDDDDDDMAIDGIQGDDSDDSDLSGEDSEDDSDEEEETPKVQPSKKRHVETGQKSPAAKKAKAATPEKTGKKGQAATPTPAKAAGNKSKEQTPKSGGQISCKSCSKTFTSANALQSHSKAKHEGK